MRKSGSKLLLPLWLLRSSLPVPLGSSSALARVTIAKPRSRVFSSCLWYVISVTDIYYRTTRHGGASRTFSGPRLFLSFSTRCAMFGPDSACGARSARKSAAISREITARQEQEKKRKLEEDEKSWAQVKEEIELQRERSSRDR